MASCPSALCAALLLAVFWTRSAHAGITYKYSPIGGELRFVKPRDDNVGGSTVNRHFQVDLDDLPFSPGTRSVLSRPSSEDALSMSPDVFRVQAMANSSPFEAFIRRWATGGLGRAGGARANWRY